MSTVLIVSMGLDGARCPRRSADHPARIAAISSARQDGCTADPLAPGVGAAACLLSWEALSR